SARSFEKWVCGRRIARSGHRDYFFLEGDRPHPKNGRPAGLRLYDRGNTATHREQSESISWSLEESRRGHWSNEGTPQAMTASTSSNHRTESAIVPQFGGS